MKSKRKNKLFVLFFISFSGSAATYNFNFYNNESEEKLGQSQSAAPAVTTIPLAPTTEVSTSEMAAEKSKEISSSQFLAGIFYYTRKSQSVDNVGGILYGPKYAGNTEGLGIKLGRGKIGGIKIEIEGLKEKSTMALFFPGRGRPREFMKTNSYGLGLNLKKEFLLGALPGIEIGMGGNYLLGRTTEGSYLSAPGSRHRVREVGTITQMSYYASVGINLYYNQFLSLNALVKVGRTNAKIKNEQAGTFSISNTQPTLVAGLTYNF